MKKELIGSLLVLASAFGFGLMGVLATYAYEDGLNVTTLLCFRFLLAAAILWVWLLGTRQNVRVTSKQLLTLALMGAVGYALMGTLLFTAFALLPISLASVLFYCYPFIVCGLAVFWFKRKVTLPVGSAMVVCFAGLVFVLGTGWSGINAWGVASAFACAFIYGLYITGTESISGRIPPLVSSAYIVTFAALALWLGGLLGGDIALPDTAVGWMAIAGIAIASTVVAIASFAAGVDRLGGSRAAILSYAEPLVTVLFGTMLFGEDFGAYQWLGTGCILTGAVLLHVKPGYLTRMIDKLTLKFPNRSS